VQKLLLVLFTRPGGGSGNGHRVTSWLPTSGLGSGGPEGSDFQVEVEGARLAVAAMASAQGFVCGGAPSHLWLGTDRLLSLSLHPIPV